MPLYSIGTGQSSWSSAIAISDAELTSQALSIQLAVRSKGPVASDLAVEVSFDGRPIHPIFIKRGNHTVNEISHHFGLDDGVPSKFSFHVNEIVSRYHH